MPISKLDTDQHSAATSQGAEIVVSAGAGSGKTSLLVARYLYLLHLRHEPISSVAAITFTNKAALQMKDRIARSAMDLAMSDRENYDSWSAVARTIHHAPISTIHSFCNAILREYPVEAGIDPQYIIPDETTLSGFRQEAVRAFLHRRMDEAPDVSGQLMGHFGLRGYRDIITAMLYDRIGVLKYLDDNEHLTAESIERRYRSYIDERFMMFHNRLREINILRPEGDRLGELLDSLVFSISKFVDMIRRDVLDELVLSGLYEELADIGRIGSKAKWDDSGLPLTRVRAEMAACRDFIDQVRIYYRRERGSTAHLLHMILDEFRLLEADYLSRKKQASYFDHDDSLVETWRLLRRNASVSRSIAARYRHILVDEFQDTDSMQMDIIRMVAGNAQSGLFTVGDPKQSIYRFRGADVTVFKQFAASKSVEFRSLRMNYRSIQGVVDFVNTVFRRIMGRDDALNDYEAAYRDMKAYRTDDGPSHPVGIVVFNEGTAGRSRGSEASWIAQCARELHVNDGFNYGDMALIMRKGTQTGSYEEAFLLNGVPFVDLTRGKPFSGPEAADITHLFGWICDPDDDEAFAGLMLSPLFALDGDFLFRCRYRAKSGESLYAGFQRIEKDNGRNTHIGDILRWLLAVGERMPAADLLERLYEKTGYTATLLADPLRGERSLAALDHIGRTIADFQARGGTLQELSALMADGSLDSAECMLDEPGRDALSIITIHKAKGLEYKVVFLADTSSGTGNHPPKFVMHDRLGPGVKLRTDGGDFVDSFAYATGSENTKLQDVAESKRLFYVGCTRAKERLYISGKSPSGSPDPEFAKDNWMGWLHDALDIGGDGDMSLAAPDRSYTYTRFDPDDPDEGSIPNSDDEKWVTYPGVLRNIAGKWASMPAVEEVEHASGHRIRPLMLSPTRIEDYLRDPERYRLKYVYGYDPGLSGDDGRSAGLGSMYGTVAHEVLERWDFNDPDASLAHVEAVAGSRLPGVMIDRLRDQFKQFASSTLHERIRTADTVRREVPFAFLRDGVMIRGTIDCLVTHGGEHGILDYKTVAATADDATEKAASYRLQLGIYAMAVERALCKKPKALTVCFLTPGIAVDIPCSDDLLDGTATSIDEAIKGIGEIEGRLL